MRLTRQVFQSVSRTVLTRWTTQTYKKFLIQWQRVRSWDSPGRCFSQSVSRTLLTRWTTQAYKNFLIQWQWHHFQRRNVPTGASMPVIISIHNAIEINRNEKGLVFVTWSERFFFSMTKHYFMLLWYHK